MIRFRTAAAMALAGCAAACASGGPVTNTSGGYGMPDVMSDTYVSEKAPPMEPGRKIVEQDCSKALETDRGNVRCK
jgi:hypothetical protein